LPEHIVATTRRHGPEGVWPYHYAGTMGFIQRGAIRRLGHLAGWSRQLETFCIALSDPGWLAGVGALCDRFEVHLICDEIAVGCGRTGTFFAHDQAEIRPDLMCLSKGISGGYLPLSLVLCSDTIYEAFLDDSVARAFLHSHSYTGNPLACRAALATLDIFEQDAVVAVNRQRAAKMAAALAPLADHPQVKHLRQRGMIAAFDVETTDPWFSRRFYRAALEREALVRPIGNTVYLMPPYVVGDEEIAHLGRAVAEALEMAIGNRG
jgi:adenosylmethionine-8-amino-7-oxononanoate aminotransferase